MPTNSERESESNPAQASLPPGIEPNAEPAAIRLQKVLAAAGVGSRRVCEGLIAEGRVSVNGQTVTELGTRVDPHTAVVALDGARLNVRAELVYLALNKPRGVITAMSDPWGRPTVGELVAERNQRLFHVGRLDGETEGLLLLTNDGELAHRLMHPSFGVAKTYLATVAGTVATRVGRQLRQGVQLDDGPAQVDSFRVIQTSAGRSIVELTLHEGRNHIVRRLLAAVGHPVERLVRTRVGPVHLGSLRAGALRDLTRDELAEIYRLVEKRM